MGVMMVDAKESVAHGRNATILLLIRQLDISFRGEFLSIIRRMRPGGLRIEIELSVVDRVRIRPSGFDLLRNGR